MSNRIPREDISLKLLGSTASIHLCSTKIPHMILRYGRYVLVLSAYRLYGVKLGCRLLKKWHIWIQEYLLCSGTVFFPDSRAHNPAPLARLIKNPVVRQQCWTLSDWRRPPQSSQMVSHMEMTLRIGRHMAKTGWCLCSTFPPVLPCGIFSATLPTTR